MAATYFTTPTCYARVLSLRGVMNKPVCRVFAATMLLVAGPQPVFANVREFVCTYPNTLTGGTLGSAMRRTSFSNSHWTQ